MTQPTTIRAYCGKRFLDLFLGCLFLLLLSPVCLGVIILIACLDPGPVLFWQPRVGMGGKCFRFPKFRSMVSDAEARQALLREQNLHGSQEVTFKMAKDPRVTRVGRFIRRHSLDEIPQLWCVLRGEMSLVGPRPPTVEEFSHYTEREMFRLAVKPGLSGLWQVSGRSNLSFHRQIELDMSYIHRQSLWLDLVILLRTIPAVLTGRGAY